MSADPSNLTVADRARQMAARIGRLPDEVIASFQDSEADQRMAHLDGVATEILLGMAPVINWLERRRSADTVEEVKRRLWSVLSDAVLCAGHETPEYAGGKVTQGREEASAGAKQTATLLVRAKLVERNLLGWARDIEAEESQQSRAARCGPDFRSVHWFGADYTFTATQAACMRVLWTAWENGTPDVSQEYILAEAGAESKRLSDVFANHPAWRTMIVSGASKGAYRLQEPPR